MAEGTLDGGGDVEFVWVVLDVSRASVVCDGCCCMATGSFPISAGYFTVWTLVGEDKLVQGKMVLGMLGMDFGRV